MLSAQSLEGSPPHPSGGPGAALAATSESVENRGQKPKNLPCQYCNKCFRRVEHVQRHERTHTKEKPFQCNWDRCGKTFGRRDLLVRHEKLVHLNDNNKDNGRSRKLSGATHHNRNSRLLNHYLNINTLSSSSYLNISSLNCTHKTDNNPHRRSITPAI
ncbi:DNA-binding protein-like protein [Emericellopsis cladophorae]|uniref:DNA-binding protein-like protein n=1 Tax=Emericellopsis cladophorae TaxID=2686198 RepID=A0A9P9Y6V0_9HYPO|nr:DNA-binding protein-like protein [Emericellopsis cladophorae]KAI6784501.1 DNA-binding protein-like protein [Emericellopsis cladophorae]